MPEPALTLTVPVKLRVTVPRRAGRRALITKAFRELDRVGIQRPGAAEIAHAFGISKHKAEAIIQDASRAAEAQL